MERFVEGQLLRVFIREDDRWHGKPLKDAIVDVLLGANVAGASVFRAVEGFGSHREIHAQRVWSFHAGMPVLIEVVDTVEVIEAIVPQLEEMIEEGMVTLERVSFRRYQSASSKTSAPG